MIHDIRSRVGKKGNTLVSIRGGQWTPVAHLKPEVSGYYFLLTEGDQELLGNAPNVQILYADKQAVDEFTIRTYKVVETVIVDGVKIYDQKVLSNSEEELQKEIAANMAAAQREREELQVRDDAYNAYQKLAARFNGGWQRLSSLGCPLPRWERRKGQKGLVNLGRYMAENEYAFVTYLKDDKPPLRPKGLLSEHQFQKILEWAKG